MTRSEQGLDDVANAVAVLGPEALGFTERKALLDEALRGVPGLTVQKRRDYGLTGGIALSVRAPPSQPMLGIRGLAVIQDGIPLTTTDGSPSRATSTSARSAASTSSGGRARCCTGTPPAGSST